MPSPSLYYYTHTHIPPLTFLPARPPPRPLTHRTGTFDYWAPEVVRQDACTEAIDMWALGVVMYIMLCGCNPFDPSAVASDKEILSNISKCVSS